MHRFNIASAVPPDAPISYGELAEKCDLREHDLQRIVRFTAVHHRVLQEPSKGFVGHTLASKLLSENDKVKDLMSLTFDECWPAHGKVMTLLDYTLPFYATGQIGIIRVFYLGGYGASVIQISFLIHICNISYCGPHNNG